MRTHSRQSSRACGDNKGRDVSGYYIKSNVISLHIGTIDKNKPSSRCAWWWDRTGGEVSWFWTEDDSLCRCRFIGADFGRDEIDWSPLLLVGATSVEFFPPLGFWRHLNDFVSWRSLRKAEVTSEFSDFFPSLSERQERMWNICSRVAQTSPIQLLTPPGCWGVLQLHLFCVEELFSVHVVRLSGRLEPTWTWRASGCPVRGRAKQQVSALIRCLRANELAAMLAIELTPTTATRDVIRSGLGREPTGVLTSFKIQTWRTLNGRLFIRKGNEMDFSATCSVSVFLLIKGEVPLYCS